MSEEKKEAAAEEKKPEPKAEKKPEAAAPEAKEKPAKAEAETPAEKREKKLAHLTLQEVEQKIEATKEKMGGYTSRYAQSLLKRQKALKAK